MRQMGWRVEELEVIFRPGSAWWSVIESVEGTKFPTGDTLQLRFGGSPIIVIGQRTDTATSTEMWFRRTATQVQDLITARNGNHDRSASIWYVPLSQDAYELWAGKVVIDR